MPGFEIWMQDAADWLAATQLSVFLQQQPVWAYAAAETLHFFGLTLLLGTVGVFDLRVLGVAKAIPPAALHKLIPWGIAGFLINLTTGAAFVIAHPHQYAFNLGFRVKVALILIAGLNVLLFYGTAFREVKEMPAGADATARGKLITGISLSSWMGVLILGGLIVGGFFG